MKIVSFIASMCAMLLVSVILYDVEWFLKIFLYFLIISVWEWLFRPQLIEIKKYLEKRFGKNDRPPGENGFYQDIKKSRESKNGGRK